MCRLNFKHIMQKTIALWIFLFASSECMAQGGVGMGSHLLGALQKDSGKSALPFVLPEQLFIGSYPSFSNAQAMREIEYTGLGRVLVYFYGTKDAAVNDAKSFAEKNTKITESGILAVHFGCLEENEQFTTEWFTVGSYIIGLRTPKSKMERTFITKAAEKIITDYDARIKRLFSTPEKCFKTYLEAVNKQEENLIIECLYDDGSEQSRNAIAMVKNMISMIPQFTMMLMYEAPYAEKKEIAIAKIEMVSDTEARIAISKQNTTGSNSLPLMLLTFGQSINRYSADDYLWVPLKMNGEKWGIDVVTTQKTVFAKSQEQLLKVNCMSNLKQIGLALHMYAQDHQKKFPGSNTFIALAPKYVPARIFKCPGDKSTPEIQGQPAAETKISYIFVEGLSTQDPPGTILAYDASAENHQGESRCVLFLDGHVRWMNEKEFQDLLNK